MPAPKLTLRVPHQRVQVIGSDGCMTLPWYRFFTEFADLTAVEVPGKIAAIAAQAAANASATTPPGPVQGNKWTT